MQLFKKAFRHFPCKKQIWHHFLCTPLIKVIQLQSKRECSIVAITEESTAKPFFFIFPRIEAKIHYISSTCFHLGVCGPQQIPGSAYLQESGAVSLIVGLLWKELCAVKLLPPTTHTYTHTLTLTHSLQYPTVDVLGSSKPKCYCCAVKEGKNQNEGMRGNLPPNTTTNTKVPRAERNRSALSDSIKHMWDAAVDQRGVHLLGEIEVKCCCELTHWGSRFSEHTSKKKQRSHKVYYSVHFLIFIEI